MITLKKLGMMSATAAVLVVGSFSTGAFAAPVDAAKAQKSDVHHYQAEDEYLLDDLGNQVLDEFDAPIVVDPLGRRVINVSGNALPAHLGDEVLHPGHGDETIMDFLIVDGDDADACTVLIDV